MQKRDDRTWRRANPSHVPCSWDLRLSVADSFDSSRPKARRTRMPMPSCLARTEGSCEVRAQREVGIQQEEDATKAYPTATTTQEVGGQGMDHICGSCKRPNGGNWYSVPAGLVCRDCKDVWDEFESRRTIEGLNRLSQQIEERQSQETA